MTEPQDPPLTVVQAMTRVMRDVGAVAKAEHAQGYNFRGVDTVVNALAGPMRTHGLIAVPVAVTELRVGSVETAAKKTMTTVHVRVEYRIYGPAGDWLPGGASGEAFDSGDKATPKAMSVAYRTFLLQAFGLPTDEPDPDLYQYERVAHEREPVEPTLSPLVAEAIAVAEKELDLPALSDVWKRAKGYGDELAMSAAAAAAERVKVKAATGGPSGDGTYPQQVDER